MVYSCRFMFIRVAPQALITLSSCVFLGSLGVSEFRSVDDRLAGLCSGSKISSFSRLLVKILVLSSHNTKVRLFPEPSKISLKMFQKTFNQNLAKYLIYNVLRIITSRLSPSYLHLKKQAPSPWCAQSVSLVGTVRHLADQGASWRDARSVLISLTASAHRRTGVPAYRRTISILHTAYQEPRKLGLYIII
jgi:hypothetical protein